MTIIIAVLIIAPLFSLFSLAPRSSLLLPRSFASLHCLAPRSPICDMCATGSMRHASRAPRSTLQVDAQKYIELLEKDVIRFGYSSREYVMLHAESQD